MNNLYGYYCSSGYYGRISRDKWMLFPTEREYIEYMKEFH